MTGGFVRNNTHTGVGTAVRGAISFNIGNLTSGANIGVYATGNYTEGAVFGTLSAAALGYSAATALGRIGEVAN